jgi:hypothetical protein
MQTLEGLHPEKLDYEFVCYYKDGSLVRQEYNTPNEKHFGHLDQDNIKVFELQNGNKKYSVNLENGEFNLDGLVCRFDLGFRNGKRLEPKEYRLIYYRRVNTEFNPDGIVQKVRYLLGWQTEIEGKNYQRFIIIEPDGSLTFSTKR